MTRTHCYINLTENELCALDKKVDELGYSGRTELLSGISRSLIYGTAYKNQTGNAAEELSIILETCSLLTELELELAKLLDSHAFAVLARLGPDAGFYALADDMREWMYEKTRVIPEDAQLKAWVKNYCAVHQAEFIQHRLKMNTERFAEEYEEKEQEAYA